MALFDEVVQEEDFDPEVIGADQQHFQEPPGA